MCRGASARLRSDGGPGPLIKHPEVVAHSPRTTNGGRPNASRLARATPHSPLCAKGSGGCLCPYVRSTCTACRLASGGSGNASAASTDDGASVPCAAPASGTPSAGPAGASRPSAPRRCAGHLRPGPPVRRRGAASRAARTTGPPSSSIASCQGARRPYRGSMGAGCGSPRCRSLSRR